MTSEEMFDVIIVGGGPMGLASAYECGVKKEKKVLLLEQFDTFANAHGSSPGYSRQFRVSYSEKNLCDLALKTYSMWQILMKEMGDSSLLQETGCLWFGDPDVETGEGNIKAAIDNLKELGEEDFDVLNGNDQIIADQRFSFVSKAVENIKQAKALFTAKGGTINVPGVVKCYEDKLKEDKHVTLMKKAKVIMIDRSNEKYIRVEAENEGRKGSSFYGRKIILTPGAYVNEALRVLQPAFKCEINLIIYIWSSTYFRYKVPADTSDLGEQAKWPIWYFFGSKSSCDIDNSEPRDFNDYYGFPSEPGRPMYLRVAPAFTSEKKFDFTDFPPPICDRTVDEYAMKFTSEFVHNSMPALNPTLDPRQQQTCIAGFVQLNDDTKKDEGAGFLLDFLEPDHRIVVFTGGWAMKFVPMIGKILSDLAIDGTTEHQELIRPMKIDRGILKEASYSRSLRASKFSVAQKSALFRKIWC